MSEAITLAADETMAYEPTTVHLVAVNPQQMRDAQNGMSAWLKAKIDYLNVELVELTNAVDHAKKHKWKAGTLAGLVTKCRQRITFYEKVLKASEAGFTIIPNFPIDVFAIRVKRLHTKQSSTTTIGQFSNPQNSVPDEKSDAAPVGLGTYVSPKQVGSGGMQKRLENGKEVIEKWWAPTGFAPEIDFPIIAAQTQVMTATQEAMALKIFDEVGICPQSQRRKGDPLIIGRIVLNNPKWGEPHSCSFLIAWHLDLRTL